MPISVCVSADVLHRKRNIEFFFDVTPTMEELRHATETSYNTLLACEGFPRTFTISTLRMYDDRVGRWVELDSSTQLASSGSQVYAFQVGVPEIPGEIPQPVPANEITYVSPQRVHPHNHHESPARNINYSAVDYSYRSQSYNSTSNYVDIKLTATTATMPVPDVPGESILRQERQKEVEKEHLDLDAHRDYVRRETQEFLSQSPSRQRSSN
eukprot:PhM_4_TR1906/c0_g1_i1/m.87101